jgi:hypothetical protein
MSEITLKPKRFNQIEQEESSFLITNNSEVKDGEVISLVLEGTTTLLKRKVMGVLSDDGLKEGYKLILVHRLKRFVAL